MDDAWANSTNTTPTAADGWDSSAGGHAEHVPYAESTTAPQERERDSRRSRSRSPTRDGADQRGRDQSSNPGTNLHISGLNSSVTDRHLEDTFSKYGKVTKAQVVYDPHTRDSRCFAFVMMANLEEAEAAIAALNGFVLEGLPLRVDKARRGRARTPTPGQYYGPPKRDYGERPYAPRENDHRYRSRYDDGYYSRGYDRGYGRGYDDHRYHDDRYGRDRFDDRYNSRSRWDDRDRYEDRYGDRYGGQYRGQYRDRYDDDRASRYNDSRDGGRYDSGRNGSRYDDSRR